MPDHAISYGDRIRLKHLKSGRYLASISKSYVHPKSSMQQMVVAFAAPTNETVWIVRGGNEEIANYGLGTAVVNGATIRLGRIKEDAIRLSGTASKKISDGNIDPRPLYFFWRAN